MDYKQSLACATDILNLAQGMQNLAIEEENDKSRKWLLEMQQVLAHMAVRIGDLELTETKRPLLTVKEAVAKESARLRIAE